MNNAKSYSLPLILLTTAAFSSMGGPALAPALPAIKAAYADIPNIEFWTKTLLSVSGLFSAIGAPLFGWLSDTLGRRKPLILALLCWGMCGASGMIPQPFWLLFAGRMAFGLSLGGLLAANTAMIAGSFSKNEQRRMMGLQSSCTSAGVILSLLASGWLADLHWRLSFGVFLSAFLVLPFAWTLPEPARSIPRKEGKQRAVLADHLGPGLLFFFGFMAMFAFNIVPTQMPFYMKTMGVQNASHIGIVLVLLPMASLISGRLYALLSKPFGTWSFFLVSGGTLLAGFYAIFLMDGLASVAMGLLLIGFGFGLAMPHVNVTLTQIVSPEGRGRALGILTAFKYLGQFFSPILLQPILAAKGYATMFHASGWIMMASAVLVFGFGMFYHHHKNSTEEHA